MAGIDPNNTWCVNQWMDYIQTLHVREIDLSLERSLQVLHCMYPKGITFKVVSVAGTNGKGSTVELLHSIYSEAGYKVAKYTSPHLNAFNERFVVNRDTVEDDVLLESLRKVEAARESVRLTYFEFGTLVAIDIFQSQAVDLAIMEVGLGGRLDAVNILDADVSVLTSISIDHTQWLGDTVEQIGLEKIGISRTGRSCVIGLTDLPNSVAKYCLNNAVLTRQLGKDFHFSSNSDNSWQWQSNSDEYLDLPLPYHQKGHQLNNAACALMVTEELDSIFPIDQEQIEQGIAKAQILGRCQKIQDSPMIVLDVSHNQSSVQELANFVASQRVQGQVYAVCGMLRDKEVAQSLSCLVEQVAEWHFVSINNERGSTAAELKMMLDEMLASGLTGGHVDKNIGSYCYDTVRQAYESALSKLNKDDALLVFGSFFIVGDIIAGLG